MTKVRRWLAGAGAVAVLALILLGVGHFNDNSSPTTQTVMTTQQGMYAPGDAVPINSVTTTGQPDRFVSALMNIGAQPMNARTINDSIGYDPGGISAWQAFFPSRVGVQGANDLNRVGNYGVSKIDYGFGADGISPLSRLTPNVNGLTGSGSILASASSGAGISNIIQILESSSGGSNPTNGTLPGKFTTSDASGPSDLGRMVGVLFFVAYITMVIVLSRRNKASYGGTSGEKRLTTNGKSHSVKRTTRLIASG